MFSNFHDLSIWISVAVFVAAVALFLFTIAATLMFHNFWAAPDAQVVMQTINFLKNLGLLGALALIAVYGPGAYSVNAAIKSGA